MKILLIDDDVGSLHGMQLALRMLRHLCDAYTNPVEAVENYAATSYDLVITDIYMPQLDGFMLADEIHAVNPATSYLCQGLRQKLWGSNGNGLWRNLSSLRR